MKAEQYFISLVGCSLNGEEPKEIPEEVEWKDVYALSRYHSMANLSFHSMDKLKKKPDRDLYARWQEMSRKSVAKELRFHSELQKILSVFEREGIPYLPLKGIILKNDYPSAGMRQMADMDILIQCSDQRLLKNRMEEIGYAYNGEHGHHHVFMKSPDYNIELHTGLLPEEDSSAGYYNKIWEMAEKAEGSLCGYRMSRDDFYIYLLAHMNKHYRGGGCGLRSLTDIYVYLTKNSPDMEYVTKELALLGLREFEQRLSSLAFSLFTGEENAVLYEKELNYLLQSGTYGTQENSIRNKLTGYRNLQGTLWNAKVQYLTARLLLSPAKLKESRPILKKYPFLYPVISAGRIFSGIRKVKRIGKEISTVIFMKDRS
ncbi:hypothetical protein HNQ56_002887 [Anaerotaenia torta]|uniref:nucleotidyltransferase domain-containing protein n=1 Tax=Anaerotaenia torta TaxID=433293 RepID=UPI003D1CA138